MDIASLLRTLKCDELAGGSSAWEETKSAYSIEQIVSFAGLSRERADVLRADHEEFTGRLNALPESDRSELKLWTMSEFGKFFWKENAPWDHPRPKHAWDFLRDVDGCGKRMLDVGTGHGFHMFVLFREKYGARSELSCCDAMPCYNKLLSACGFDARYYDAETMRLDEIFEPASFDAATCCEMLEHVPEKAEDNILSSVASILRSGGKLLITFPEHAAPFFKDPSPIGHCRQPDVEAVIRKLEAAGMDAKEQGLLNSGKVYQRVITAEKR